MSHSFFMHDIRPHWFHLSHAFRAGARFGQTNPKDDEHVVQDKAIDFVRDIHRSQWASLSDKFRPLNEAEELLLEKSAQDLAAFTKGSAYSKGNATFLLYCCLVDACGHPERIINSAMAQLIATISGGNRHVTNKWVDFIVQDWPHSGQYAADRFRTDFAQGIPDFSRYLVSQKFFSGSGT